MTSPTATRHANRLIHETSPYLLQHAYNPVDWYPWGEEALRRAREEDKPILLSIGYSACHWCHVMERESFEDEEIAALMNRHFVCVKVDREERPDLDDIYMAATQTMNAGQGGWPMTVFLTPDQRPFFAGTYFPPEDRYGRPGFPTLLRWIAGQWRTNRAALTDQANRLSEYLRRQVRPAPSLTVGMAELDAASAQFARDFDPVHGGFGPAPKFPAATGLSLLLRQHRRTGDAHALHMVRKTLDAMACGGIYDQIGGGFARYSTDERWLVPHFEKMLYDNALLAKVYLEAYQVTGEPSYRRVAAEVLDYVLREMTSLEGGFYSATDADSEGVEGKFFVWSPAEIEAVLGKEEGRRFCAYYDITEEGNWEGKSIPNVPRALEDVAASLGIAAEELRRSLDDARPRIYEARLRRVPPGLDDKILTAWNGMMISVMAEGYRLLEDARYLEAAIGAADFLLTTLTRDDGGLLRTYRTGQAHLAAYLEDYAYLGEALIDLHEAGGAARYLSEAERLANRMLADFSDEEAGGFYSTARDHEDLLLRHREGMDGAIPSGNAVAASVLARLSFHLDRDDFREAATKAITAYGRAIARHPRAFAKSLAVVDFLLEGPVELALLGRRGEAGFDGLRRAIASHYLPNRVIAYHDPEAGDAPPFPLLAGKDLVAGKAALYVCRDYACQAPITEPGDVAAALAGRRAERAEKSDGGDAASPGAAQLATKRALTAAPRPGHATPAGTAAYAGRFVDASGRWGYAPLGATGLTVSRVGFGCYRVQEEVLDHREALERALLSGANLIDTSTNYADGGSERLVGTVVNDLAGRERLRREEVVIVSKIGYVQGANLTLAREREVTGRPFPEMVKYMEGVWHCIHPEFLRDQLGRSLERLGLGTLDVCLLHNPEYFFSDAKRRGADSLERLRDEFYRRVREAFRFFERRVAEGVLDCYGVSSNTMAAPASDPEATSLWRVLDVAREAGGANHHFRVLQLPMNLFEAGALFERNTGPQGSDTVLELAAREGIAVLVNRPLNAIAGGAMLRLADVRVDPPEAEFEGSETAIGLEAQPEELGTLEAEYQAAIAPGLLAVPGTFAPEGFFSWADQLRVLAARLPTLEQWREIEEQVVVPHTVQAVAVIGERLPRALEERWQGWRERYLPALQRVLLELGRKAARNSQARSSAIAAAIDPWLPEERRGETLSRKAIWVLASTPGVTSVLNGMRTNAYVDDTLAVLRWLPLEDVLPVYRAVRNLELPPS